MNISIDVKSFIYNYNANEYRGGKVRIDGMKIPLREVTAQIFDSLKHQDLSAYEIDQIKEKLNIMYDKRAERKYKLTLTNAIPFLFNKVIGHDLKKSEESAFETLKEYAEIKGTLSPEAHEFSDTLIGEYDKFIDSLFATLPIPTITKSSFIQLNTTIMVHLKEDNGSGDIMLCIKTIKALKQKYPELDFQVSVETRTMRMEDVLQRISTEVDAFVFPYDQRPQEVPDPAVLIVIPEEVVNDVEKLWKFAHEPQRLNLKEYGWGEALMSGGLSDCSLGIFLDAGLASVETTQTDAQAIHGLANVQVSNIILEGFGDELYNNTHKLYVGYAHLPNPTAGFINSIIVLNKKDEKDIDFFIRTENVIPGVNWKMERSENGLECRAVRNQGAVRADLIPFGLLAEAGFAEVEIVKVRRELVGIEIDTPAGKKTVKRLEPIKNLDGTFQIEKEKTEIPNSIGTKTLRILDLYPVTHEDMLTLTRASELEMLVTGNQSFSEAVSAKKHFFYEVVPNDDRFAFQMHALAKKIDAPLQEAIKTMQCYESLMDYEAVAHFLSNPRIRQGFLEYGEKVQREFNLGDRLAAKVKTLLWAHHSPDIKLSLSMIKAELGKFIGKRELKKEALLNEGQKEQSYGPVKNDLDDLDELITQTLTPLAFLRQEVDSLKKNL